MSHLIKVFGFLLIQLGLIQAAHAQTTTYTNTVSGVINESATTCANPLRRDFEVLPIFTVADVNIGVVAAHTFRGDLRMFLRSPSGVLVQINSGVGAAADNFNVLFDQQAATALATHTANDTATSSASAPPYQRTFQPSNSLAAFNGLAAAGTWQLQICDAAAGDAGTFYRADLYLTATTTGLADLSLTQSINPSSPQTGARVDYTLTVTNNSSSVSTASGIQVSNVLNAALIYRSQSGTGTYDSASGVWAVGSLAPGASASITLSVANNSTPGTSISNYAQITSSSAADPDSTVNNASTTEDDDDSVTFTTANYPPSGTSPILTCPVTSAVFDWDAQAWTNGSLTGAFNVTNIGPMALNITGATNRLIADPASGNATPVRNTSSTGGAAGQNSLMLAVDLANTSETLNATWTFANGVAGLQFTIADLDLFFGQFEDRVTVTGSYKGVAVTPTLTNFGANTVAGNTATATALANNANADGNVRVTFSSPVDTVTINYGSTATAPADPGIQAIALMDMTMCRAATDLSLAKSVSASNPATGAAISYTLTVSNATANAMETTGVTAADILPTGFAFTSASGTGTYNSGTGLWTIGTLAKGATATLTINGTVTAAAGATVTNNAQITASGLADPDSTPNNGVTTEDDFATASFTVLAVINCPAGTTATGSGYASAGTGAFLNQIFWLDWSCGGTSTFSTGSIVNKSWTVGDGLIVTGQITGSTAPLAPYITGTWTGDTLDNLYSGLNPIGLRPANVGDDPLYNLTLSATLNGVPVSLRFVAADAEDASTSNEFLTVGTNGTAWQLVEQTGVISIANTGSSFTLNDIADAGGGTAVLETTGSTVQMNVNIASGGIAAAAFGLFTPFDFSDAPLTGTTYGAANHRTVSALRMGAAFTTEGTAYDSPTASADVDDAVTFPGLFQNQAATVNVPVTGPGFLSAWADWNDDGDFADPGEKYANDVVDGGAGDADATVNGVIALPVTPPATAATSATIGRFRFSSRTGAPTSGLHGFGEVEDYLLTVTQPRLDVTKTSYIVSDGISLSNPKSVPGAVVRYCILVTNTGSAPATNVSVNDVLPTDVTYIPSSMLSGSSCATAVTPEDDNAVGADESDPFGMSIAGSTITGTASTLAVGVSYALVFNATVD